MKPPGTVRKTGTFPEQDAASWHRDVSPATSYYLQANYHIESDDKEAHTAMPGDSIVYEVESYFPVAQDTEGTVNASGDAAKLHLDFLDSVTLPENIMLYKQSWANSSDVQTLKPTKTMDVHVSF